MLQRLFLKSAQFFQHRGDKKFWLAGSVLTVSYFVAAKIGLAFTTISDNVTLLWAPSGMALFALLVLGSAYWVWIALGAFIVNLTTGIPLLAVIGITVGNTLEAIFAVYLLRLANFDYRLSRVRDVLLLAFLAAAISTTVSSSIGVLSLTSFGALEWDKFFNAWVIWWMGDAMGDLVFGPLLLSWWFGEKTGTQLKRIPEALLLLVSVAVITQVVFGNLWDHRLPLSFVTFPFLIWGSLRFGMRGATSIVFVVGTILLIDIMLHKGLFSHGTNLQSFTLLWLYTNFLAVTSMVLAAAITERRAAEMGMRHLALHDPLTGLPNRAALNDRIEQAIQFANRQGSKFALLYLDIDRFKTINDSLGHSVGDEMLQEVSQRLLHCVRREDTVCRLGGDEFVILVVEVRHPEQLYKLTGKIIKQIHAPIQLKNTTLHTSVSIGICLYPTDGKDSVTLLKHSDIAMYRAKDLGRDTFMYYSSDMNDQAEQRLSMENALRDALEKKEFSLQYQPQFDTHTGRIHSAEALLRWHAYDTVSVSPGTFIPVLEETGQIVNVGAWVIDQACKQLAQWHAAGRKDLRIAINISSVQLNHPGLAQVIANALQQYRINAECLELEITESMLVRQDERVEQTFNKLIDLGVRLAVDDFGTGYSSLSYLHRLSIDTLKIDRSFIEQVPGNRNSESIARAIAGLGKSLDLTLIAEGVENRQQHEFVKKLDCDYIQGFLLSKPLDADAFMELLEQHKQTLETVNHGQ